MPAASCASVGTTRSSGFSLCRRCAVYKYRPIPMANSNQDSAQQVARFGLTLMLKRLMTSELPFTGELHVRRFEAQPHPVCLALHGAVRIANGDVVDRLGALPPQPAAEA